MIGVKVIDYWFVMYAMKVKGVHYVESLGKEGVIRIVVWDLLWLRL